ncbi:MAG: hypothetical protein ABR926_16850 [Streptosporangiaceae bacterium]
MAVLALAVEDGPEPALVPDEEQPAAMRASRATAAAAGIARCRRAAGKSLAGEVLAGEVLAGEVLAGEVLAGMGEGCVRVMPRNLLIMIILP